MPRVSKKNSNIQEIKIDNPATPGYFLSWINIANAGKKEIDYLQRRVGFNIEHLKASIATVFAQRPTVEIADGYVFIILHFPTFRGERIVPGEIEFFLGHGYMITLHNGNLEPLDNFFDYCRKNPKRSLSYESESSSLLLYELLSRLLKNCYNILDQNSININEVEEIIFDGQQKRAVGQILELRRNIINIRKIMRNHTNILKHLQGMKSSLVPQESINRHYEDLTEHSQKIWEILDLQKELVEVLNDTNESLLNDRMNDIMKTLTIFSVIVFPLTLISSIFGMNTHDMPFVNGPYGFWVIIGIMLLASLVMLIFFHKKRWL